MRRRLRRSTQSSLRSSPRAAARNRAGIDCSSRTSDLTRITHDVCLSIHESTSCSRIFLSCRWETMTTWILRFLQAMCLAVCSLIVIDIFVDVVKVGPPPVPLDKEGHMAPWSEDPAWDIPDLPDDSPSSQDARSR